MKEGAKHVAYIRSGVVKKVVFYNPVHLGYLTEWAVMHLLEHRSFARENHVPGLSRPVKWIPASHTLVLGPPLIISASNLNLPF
ncbi:MAG: hypothetical protein ACRD0J_07945 [Acidimicrobiales bacterium]